MNEDNNTNEIVFQIPPGEKINWEQFEALFIALCQEACPDMKLTNFKFGKDKIEFTIEFGKDKTEFTMEYV